MEILAYHSDCSLGILLFRQAQPYMNGILGGFTLYLLLRGFTNWLKSKIKPLVAVWIVTIGTTLFILIPLSLFSWAVVNQISNLHFDTADIIRPAQQMIDIIEKRTGFDVLSEKTCRSSSHKPPLSGTLS